MADPLAPVLNVLRRRQELLGWTVTHRRLRGEQLFSDRTKVEARRTVEKAEIAIQVLCAANGDPDRCGEARVRVGVDQDASAAVDFAVRAAQGVRNPIYQLASPAPLPDVPARDPAIADDPVSVVAGLHGRLMQATAAHPQARLAQAEWFAEEEEEHLVNSRGIDAFQVRTEVALDWVALAGTRDHRVDTGFDLTRRRLADLDVEAEWERVARQTADRERAGPAPNWSGPVVLRGAAVRSFLGSGVIEMLASAQARFARISTWEPGASIFRGDVRGDPLTVWSTRLLPFGSHAGGFDGDGLPGQRTLLVEDGIFRAYAASQRYAAYLAVPATGDVADLELSPGTVPAAELLSEPHVEIVAWSWFSPEPTSGDFASEIRLGYLVEDGNCKPFSGGLLVGNLLEALADVRWSAETAFHGSYQGPTTARFASLRVAPSRNA